jgi:hypothetical protein
MGDEMHLFAITLSGIYVAGRELALATFACSNGDGGQPEPKSWLDTMTKWGVSQREHVVGARRISHVLTT